MPTCPHCGHEADASADECPLCGTPLGEAASGAAGTTPADAARTVSGGPTRAGTTTGRGGGPAGADGLVPWEDPEGWVFGGLLTTWKECLFEPERFFAALDHQKPLVRPLLYYLLITVVSGFLSLLWQTMFQSMIGLPGGSQQGGVDLLLSFFLTPFVFLFCLLIGGALVHLSVTIVARDEMRPTDATYRVLCYGSSPLLLGIIPIAGSVLAPAWSLVVTVLGVKEVHRTNTGRAVIAVLAPLVIFVVGMVLLMVVVFSATELGELYKPQG